jgi:hypothetical protein
MISYQQARVSPGRADGFSKTLKSAQVQFNESNINILGEGYQEVVNDDTLFEDYKDIMMQGVDADDVETMGQLIDNSRLVTLRESMSGITPISSLSVPTLRKLWPRMALKNAIPTEVVKLPKFTISYMLPYVFKYGKRYYLPEDIMPGGAGELLVEGQPVYQDEIYLADFTPSGEQAPVDGAAKGFCLFNSLPNLTGDPLFAPIASKARGDSLDPDFSITEVGLLVGPVRGTMTNLRAGCGLHGDIYIEVSALVNGSVTTDTLFGRIDRVEGTVTLACTKGYVEFVKVRGRLSPEFNTESESVSFDIQTRDVTIGQGTHLNAPLPIEFLQDVMAMYNIDGAAKVVDIMTNVLALKLDYEMRNFITDSFLVTNNRWLGTFDCEPYAQFAGTPTAWREQLKDVIDHWATRVKQECFFQGGKFVIVGNEVDIRLLPNVTWTFTPSGGEKSGVEVDYTIGAVSGAHRYDVIGTPAIPTGAIYIFYVSSQDEQMTYKYFPYSFNVEKGYEDPNHHLVPSIMIAKRHKLERFKDAMIKVNILHNNGDFSFGQS